MTRISRRKLEALADMLDYQVTNPPSQCKAERWLTEVEREFTKVQLSVELSPLRNRKSG